jgi:hypothetical protein
MLKLQGGAPLNFEKSCVGKRLLIPNQSEHTFVAYNNVPAVPFTSNQFVSISGYVLNNSSSMGPISVKFQRGGIKAPPLPYTLDLQPGEYRTFTIVAIDTILISTVTEIATGDLNITINFNSY